MFLLIDFNILLSFEIKAILLISSVKTCFSPINLCCVFNISLLFFMNSLKSSLRRFTSILCFPRWFLLFSIWAGSKTVFGIFEFNFTFYDTLFCAYCFFHLYYHQLLSKYKFLLLIQQIFSWFFNFLLIFINPITFYFFV